MFIYGLYAIETLNQHQHQQQQQHQQHQQQLLAAEGRRNFARQKSYSISDNYQLKNVKLRNSLNVVNSNVNSMTHAGVNKYETNLCKFEHYLEQIKKLEEQKKLEEFLLNNAVCVNEETGKFVVKRAQRRNTYSLDIPDEPVSDLQFRSKPHRCGRLVDVGMTTKSTGSNSRSSVLLDSMNNLSIHHTTQQHHYQPEQQTRRVVMRKRDSQSTTSFVSNQVMKLAHMRMNSNSSSDSKTSLNGNVKPIKTCKSSSKKWINNILGRFKRSYSTAS